MNHHAEATAKVCVCETCSQITFLIVISLVFLLPSILCPFLLRILCPLKTTAFKFLMRLRAAEIVTLRGCPFQLLNLVVVLRPLSS